MRFRFEKNLLFHDDNQIYHAPGQIKKILEYKAMCVICFEHGSKLTTYGHRNVAMIDSNGNLIWEIPPAPAAFQPGEGAWKDGISDWYVDIKIIDGKIKAWSSSCYRFTLNPDTGELSDQVFTK